MSPLPFHRCGNRHRVQWPAPGHAAGKLCQVTWAALAGAARICPRAHTRWQAQKQPRAWLRAPPAAAAPGACSRTSFCWVRWFSRSCTLLFSVSKASFTFFSWAALLSKTCKSMTSHVPEKLILMMLRITMPAQGLGGLTGQGPGQYLPLSQEHCQRSQRPIS